MIGEAAFTTFLLDQGLGPLWHQAIQAYGLHSRLSPSSLDALKAARFAAAARYLAQSSALRQIDEMFTSRGIAYVVIKGVHVRELAYEDPSLRPAGDIDLLVSPKQCAAAAWALVDMGFCYQALPETASHEASFAKGQIHIDLHWDVLRPGRTRHAMADALLARRRKLDGFWGLDGTDAVFLMLTHPVFAKYVCSPHMALCRVVDFDLWVRRQAVDWAALALQLDDAGLKTAAWTLLRWFAMLGVTVPDRFMDQLRPGVVRAFYLDYWLEHDLPTRWLVRRPWLIQLGLTLPVHDRPADAWRAVHGWLRSRYSGCAANPFAQAPEYKA